MHVDRALARIGTRRGLGGNIERVLAANQAHRAAGGHGARNLDTNGLTGVGGGARNAGEEAIWFAVVAQLEQVACANRLGKPNERGPFRAADGIAHRLALRGCTARIEAHDLAYDLTAVVRALVAHHLIARGAKLVGAGEIAIEAALQLAGAPRLLLGSARMACEDVV